MEDNVRRPPSYRPPHPQEAPNFSILAILGLFGPFWGWGGLYDVSLLGLRNAGGMLEKSDQNSDQKLDRQKIIDKT